MWICCNCHELRCELLADTALSDDGDRCAQCLRLGNGRHGHIRRVARGPRGKENDKRRSTTVADVRLQDHVDSHVNAVCIRRRQVLFASDSHDGIDDGDLVKACCQVEYDPLRCSVVYCGLSAPGLP